MKKITFYWIYLFSFLLLALESCTNNNKAILTSDDSMTIAKAYFKNDTIPAFKIDSVAIFNNLLKNNYYVNFVVTEPIDTDTGNSYRQYFIDKFHNAKQEKFDVWVDKSAIWTTETEYKKADGFIISPILYKTDGVSRTTHITYKAENIGFMIRPTQAKSDGSHEAINNKAFDFNNPCPNYPNCPKQ